MDPQHPCIMCVKFFQDETNVSKKSLLSARLHLFISGWRIGVSLRLGSTLASVFRCCRPRFGFWSSSSLANARPSSSSVSRCPWPKRKLQLGNITRPTVGTVGRHTVVDQFGLSENMSECATTTCRFLCCAYAFISQRGMPQHGHVN